ncbi:MAG: Copper chaperone CopZ [Pseudomonadota bacterium]
MDNTFQVEGMTCGHCEMAVKKAIARLDPEAKVEIDRSTGKVEVHSTQKREDIAHAIAEEGYQVA